MADPLPRSALLAYRYTVHDLAKPGTGEVVLDAGLQDYPPGRSAHLALKLRTHGVSSAETALVHSLRGALHLHHTADLSLLAAALRIDDGHDLSRQSVGPFPAQLAETGVSFAAALDEVASAMRAVVTDGQVLTKGDLSGAVSPLVDSAVTPWCEGCGVFHVHDFLFRCATLQAGLSVVLDPESPSQFRYVRTELAEVSDVDGARAEVLRRYLAATGASDPANFAAWANLTTKAAHRWWSLISAELEPRSVEGRKRWVHSGDANMFRSLPQARGARLLPPYDPLTELADREFLVPDGAQRRKVWRAAANPGVVLVDGEIRGIWRQRQNKRRLTLRVEPFGTLESSALESAEPDASVIAHYFGASEIELDM